jgi:hypothetical protein
MNTEPMKNEEIRDFLKSQNALLVHFDSPMTRHPELQFPDNLLRALRLVDVNLSFSTIMPGDTNPFMQGLGGAEGCVGVMADLGSNSIVVSVAPGDSGSGSGDANDESDSLGVMPTREACLQSIEKRKGSNEWRVRNFDPLGIFILPPIFVRRTVEFEGQPVAGDLEIDLATAIAPFPEAKIYTADGKGFLSLDRRSLNWRRVNYDEIVQHKSEREADDQG